MEVFTSEPKAPDPEIEALNRIKREFAELRQPLSSLKLPRRSPWRSIRRLAEWAGILSFIETLVRYIREWLWPSEPTPVRLFVIFVAGCLAISSPQFVDISGQSVVMLPRSFDYMPRPFDGGGNGDGGAGDRRNGDDRGGSGDGGDGSNGGVGIRRGGPGGNGESGARSSSAIPSDDGSLEPGDGPRTQLAEANDGTGGGDNGGSDGTGGNNGGHDETGERNVR